MCDQCDKVIEVLSNTTDICISWLEDFTCDYDGEYHAALVADVENLPIMMGKGVLVDQVIAARLEGVPVPPSIAHEILANMDMNTEDYANLHKNDGELKTAGVVLLAMGEQDMAERAFAGVYSG